MSASSISRSATTALATLMVIALGIGIGCSSSPEESDQAPAPMEPTEEEPETTEDPYEQPQDPPPEAGTQQPAQPMGPEQAEVDEAQLEKFADVVVATAHLEQEIEQRMQGVETQEEAQQIEMEILADLEEEVLAAGLTMQEYGVIAQQVQTDPQVQQQLQELLEARGQGHLLQQPGM